MEHSNNFEILVKDVLESEYRIKLYEGAGTSVNSKGLFFDYHNLEQRVYVEIINTKSSKDLRFIQNKIQDLYALNPHWVSKLPITQIMVFSFPLSENERKNLTKSFSGEQNKQQPIIYDIEDIKHLAKENAINDTSYRRPLVKEVNSESITESLSNKDDKEPEVIIDIDERVVIGRLIGAEIRKYNVFFLPNSSTTSIGRNGITSKILEILGINRSTLNLEKEFLKNGYQWIGYKFGERVYHFCFILTRDEAKNFVDFEGNLESSLIHFKESEYIIESGLLEPKVFIPLLGAGQAGMSSKRSFDIISKGISRFYEDLLSPSLVRLNLPLDFSNQDLIDYGSQLLNQLNLEPHPEFSKSSIEKEKTKDKIPFHLDNVETIDKLNREPVAKSLARLINKDIFDKDGMNHSFMVHLQGEWGSGKSTFLNLIEKHLDTDHRSWVVIKYNAWQNQHILPPWWSFIDQIYLGFLKSLKFWNIKNLTNSVKTLRFREKTFWISYKSWNIWKSGYYLSLFIKYSFLLVRENSRRIIKYSSAYKAFTFTISILLLLVIFNYGQNIFQVINKLINSNYDGEMESFKLSDLSELFVTLSVIIGIIIAIAKFFSTPILMNSAEDAKSFLKRATNPMDKIKVHFNSLIKDINLVNYEVAVFIDDIDRCNREYTIELLEGIQTLFKERRVLYIVAGDTKWITSCFKNNYSEFSEIAKSQGQNLGELFLEKAFQLSVRMPDVSEASKQAYWKEIIGDTFEQKQEDEHVKDILASEMREEIKERLIKNYNENRNDASERNSIEQEYNISGQQVTDLAIEALDEDAQDVRHLLMSYHTLISPNPRSIKRLANNYSMYRNTLIAEQTDFKPGHLFRWLLLEDKYPKLILELLKSNNLQDFLAVAKDLNYSRAQILDIETIIMGREDFKEEELKIEVLTQILRK